jgi:4'-phosphopantetheinyl transferase
MIGQLRATLATDELERARRLHFERDRERFIAARGILRAILGRYLAIAPQHLRFAYSPRGKPALATDHEHHTLRFNLAHSHNLALYALAAGRDIGIDLEHIRANIDHEQIAQRFFAPAEYDTLQRLPPEEQLRAFFTCWTRKESYIKACGDGLWQALDQIEVFPALRTPSQATASNEPPWTLSDLEAGSGYAAALTVAGQGAVLRSYDWPQP